MKFYNRIEELKLLEKLDRQAEQEGVMTILTGRRRVGKTVLALHHVAKKRFLYLFVSRKEEHLLCEEFLEEIKKQFVMPIIGEIRYFKEVFALLLEIGKKEKFTVIFDEFQEFFQINPSVYSDLQKLWDLNRYAVKLQVVFIGSVYSLMHKIFEEEKQPLFGRANRVLEIKAFSFETTTNILRDNGIFSANNLFMYYVFTGNMPKYLDIFLTEKAKNLDDILNIILQKNSLFLNEGKTILIEEFGRDYLTYFAILELIAQGKTARNEIESVLERNVGGYLARLELDYGIVRRHRPIHAKPNTRNQKYKIADNFLNFWFRFIYHNQAAIEIENFAYVKEIIKRDYATYCGPMLEKYFQNFLAESGQFNQVGAYWEKNNQNEIDVVGINDMKKQILIAETKLNKAKISLKALETRAQALLQHYPGYTPTYLALSVEDDFSIKVF